MGIRIHVEMGYGDNKFRHGLKDPRFSKKFVESFQTLTKKQTTDMYFDYVSTIASSKTDDREYEFVISDAKNLLSGYRDMIGSFSIRDVMRSDPYDDENQKRNQVILFIPPIYKDWKRYDDPIDYHESIGHGVVKFLVNDSGFSYPIWPNALYVNKKTGKIIFYSNLVTDVRRLAKDDVDAKLSDYLKPEGLKKLSDQGLTTMKQLREDVVPEIPFSLRAFFFAFGVFEDNLSMYSLKPMIYKYWA